MKEQELVDKKRQKELEKAQAKAPAKKTNGKSKVNPKANGKESEKSEQLREAQKQVSKGGREGEGGEGDIKSLTKKGKWDKANGKEHRAQISFVKKKKKKEDHFTLFH